MNDRPTDEWGSKPASRAPSGETPPALAQPAPRVYDRAMLTRPAPPPQVAATASVGTTATYPRHAARTPSKQAAVGMLDGCADAAARRGAGDVRHRRRVHRLRHHRGRIAGARRAASARQPVQLDADLRSNGRPAQRGGRSELRPAHRRLARCHLALPEGGDACHRRPELLRASRRGSGGHRARALSRGQVSRSRFRAGRQHDHPAVGQADLPVA